MFAYATTFLKRMAGIKTDWKDEILAQTNDDRGVLEKVYNGKVTVKDINDLKVNYLI